MLQFTFGTDFYLYHVYLLAFALIDPNVIFVSYAFAIGYYNILVMMCHLSWSIFVQHTYILYIMHDIGWSSYVYSFVGFMFPGKIEVQIPLSIF